MSDIEEVPRRGRPPILGRCITLAAMIPVLAGVGWLALALWGEWHGLQSELAAKRDSNIIGFVGIHPNLSYAQKPADWYHDEGGVTRLWSGWTPGVGHGWFEVKRGEIDRGRLSTPAGRDATAVIDSPLVEIGGGIRWDHIPPGAPVVVLEARDISTAYPYMLMRKVVLVNDMIGAHPYLLTYTPFVAQNRSIDIYDSMLDGRRMTMGLTGYLYDSKPILYDRESESLWVGRAEGMTAIAGRLKDAHLPRVDQPQTVEWAGWRDAHPRGRLMIGSDPYRDQHLARRAGHPPTLAIPARAVVGPPEPQRPEPLPGPAAP